MFIVCIHNCALKVSAYLQNYEVHNYMVLDCGFIACHIQSI